jgi:DNA (cytosine-5)-methyltransferase 1
VNRPLLLDLFSGAGGAAEGYARAGFRVVGVDHVEQPRYPFEFVRADALEFLETMLAFRRRQFDRRPFRYAAIHASPPCQAFTRYRRRGPDHVNASPNLIAQTRTLLEATGLPYVIENVDGAPLNDPVLICGSMFDPVMTIRRHRLFETNWPLEPPLWPCRHRLQVGRFYPGGASRRDHGDSRTLVRATVEIGTWDIPIETQRAAMDIPWMELGELTEAIPPAYTELIGAQLVQHVRR